MESSMMLPRSPRCPRAQILIGWLGLALLVVFSACSDATSPVAGPEPGAPPALEISDAAHGGSTDGFFFLRPLVSSPSYSGSFDGELSPTVHICAGATASCAGAEVALFTTETGPGSETVRVDEDEEHYIVNWHTDEFDLISGETYRVSVRVAGTLLGYADVVPAANGAEMKSIDTEEDIGLKNGRTLPVKFRIETGTVFPVGSAGGTITTEDEAVVLEIPEGALSEEVGITIEPDGNVASGVGLLAGSVYDFEPDGLEFSPPASLTIAFSPTDGLAASAVAVLDELESGDWDELPSIADGTAKTVTADIDGFSRKGVGKRADAVEVSPDAAELDLTDNTTAQFSATVQDATGADLTRRKVRWTVGDEEVATVDKNGLVTAVGDGTTYVEAQAGRASGRADVTVGANEPPTADITSPADGATFTEDEAISFEGSGSDPEDGTLTGSSLVWTSDLDGQLGTGTSVSSSLSVGSHTVTLTATDSDGETGTAAVSVTVDPAPTSNIPFVFSRNGSVYTIDRDGTHANQLITSSFISPPAYTKWSPDGSKIAFIGDGDIYVVNADGTGLEKVTDHGSVTDALAWSPDGARLIFESGLSGSDEFWITSLDDPNGSRVTAFGGNGITGVDWGQGEIVFSHFNLIYTLPASELDGLSPLPGTPDATLIEDGDGTAVSGKNPVWSPDGARIAFVGDDGLDQNVFVMNADGSSISSVGILGARTSPAWSPDGSEILFSADEDGTFGGGSDLYVASLMSGGHPVQITSEFNADDLHPHWNPAWSEPDSP
jgi:Tol biopolymer transport system component